MHLSIQGVIKNMDFEVRYASILIHPLIQPFRKHLLRIYQVPGTGLVAEDTASNKIKFLPSLKLYSGESSGRAVVGRGAVINIQALLFLSNLTLGKSLYLSKLQFPQLQIGNNKNYLRLFWEINQTSQIINIWMLVTSLSSGLTGNLPVPGTQHVPSHTTGPLHVLFPLPHPP